MSELSNLGVDCLLGGDAINRMHGVTVRKWSDSKYLVRWGKPYLKDCCGAPQNERAHAISITGVSKVDQKWPGSDSRSLQVEDLGILPLSSLMVGGLSVGGGQPSQPEGLQTQLSEYKCAQASYMQECYCAELESCISNGLLNQWDGPVQGVIPLLNVFQPTKDKVHPVMDYHELNDFHECHTHDEMVAVCGEKVRKWRQLQGELKVVELKSAYLQVHISEDLWKYQILRL